MCESVCGYTVEVVASPTPVEYLKCGLCSHILRDPLQIMPCGHRFCNSCFQQTEAYSALLNTPLVCTLDGNEIQESQVFDDTALHRIIMESSVKCSFKGSGCKWMGELKDLDDHTKSCTHGNRCSNGSKSTTCTMTDDEDEFSWKKMCSRMDKFEEILNEKGIEITSIKEVLKETKDELYLKCKEVDLMKLKTDSLEKEIELLKKTNDMLQCKDEMIIREGRRKRLDEDGCHRHSTLIEKNEVWLSHHIENGQEESSLRQRAEGSDNDPGEMILIKSLENKVHDRLENIQNEQQSKLNNIYAELDELKIQMDQLYGSDTSSNGRDEIEERKLAADAMSDQLPNWTQI